MKGSIIIRFLRTNVAKKLLGVFTVVVLMIVTGSTSWGQPIQWQGNGHYYELIETPEVTWPDACQQAALRSFQGLRGHLVTFNSQAEFDFVLGSVVPQGTTTRYWAGGYQPSGSGEPTADWFWVTGEPWDLSIACSGQINNLGCGGSQEDVLEIVPNELCLNDSPWCYSRGYVVEYETGSFGCLTIEEGGCAQFCGGGPFCPANGDLNGSGGLSGADIVILINCTFQGAEGCLCSAP